MKSLLDGWYYTGGSNCSGREYEEPRHHADYAGLGKELAPGQLVRGPFDSREEALFDAVLWAEGLFDDPGRTGQCLVSHAAYTCRREEGHKGGHLAVGARLSARGGPEGPLGAVGFRDNGSLRVFLPRPGEFEAMRTWCNDAFVPSSLSARLSFWMAMLAFREVEGWSNAQRGGADVPGEPLERATAFLYLAWQVAKVHGEAIDRNTFCPEEPSNAELINWTLETAKLVRAKMLRQVIAVVERYRSGTELSGQVDALLEELNGLL